MSADDAGAVARVQAAFARACLGRERPFDGDLRGFLETHGVPRGDAEAMLASPRRLGLYRQLVRHNLTAVVGTMLEATRSRLEARAPGVFDRTLAAFLDEEGPRTPHLRDVPSELLAYAAPRWRADRSVPPWAVDHAELELADFTVGVAPRPPAPPPVTDVAVDRALVFAEPRRLLHLGWAVNRLPREDAQAEPEARELSVLVYRDVEHRSRFLELSPLAGAILEELLAGSALGAAMRAACEAKAHPLDDAVLGGAARLLADLGERGVLLGARAEEA